MLFPKKVKYRRWQTKRSGWKGVARRGTTLQYGSHAVIATTQARVTSNQIEAARKVVSRTLGKLGSYWIRVFPDRPITRKAAEVGMGKGKGNPDGFCVQIKPGRILFEVDGVSDEVAREALRKAGTKLPVKIKIITREIA